jgi:hypothetical protein
MNWDAVMPPKPASSPRFTSATPRGALTGCRRAPLRICGDSRRATDGRVFKGGTCLKKCYFETYRFSEDLDFTLRDENHLDVKFLRPVFEEVVAWVTEQSGLTIPANQLEFDIYDSDIVLHYL